MKAAFDKLRRLAASFVALAILAPASTLAQTAVRDLSAYTELGTAFTVEVSIAVPPNVLAAGYEDAPPAGWAVSGISDGGSYDAVSESVKWGPFFEPMIPKSISYDVLPNLPGTSGSCFAGTVSLDGDEEAIAGDACLAIAIPAASQWGAFCLALGVLIAASGIWRKDVMWR